VGIELSRALEELAVVIAKLRYIEEELRRVRQLELKRQREQAPPDDANP
jgi:hypothetical protein